MSETFRTVSEAEFWTFVRSTRRDIHPRSEPERSVWIDQHTYEVVAVSMPGYLRDGARVFQIKAGEESR